MPSLVAVFVVLLEVNQPSFQLPPSAKERLNHRFPNWELIDYSTRLYGDKAKDIFYWGKPFYKCNLNRDTIPDYAFGITVNEGSALMVHFVALVSDKDSFSLFILGTHRNPKPLSVYLYLYSKGEEIANFGFDEAETVPPTLLRTWNRDELFSQFDTDCISIHRTDKNVCSAFIFHEGQFWSFEACD